MQYVTITNILNKLKTFLHYAHFTKGGTAVDITISEQITCSKLVVHK